MTMMIAVCSLLCVGRVGSYDFGGWCGALWLVVAVGGGVVGGVSAGGAVWAPGMVDAVWSDSAVFACGGVVVHDVRALGFLSGSARDGEAGYCGWVCDVYAGRGGAGVFGEPAEAYGGDGYAGGTPKGGGAAAMVLLSGFAYVVYYLIFGSITYNMFTRQYYPGGADLARSMGLYFG